MIAMRIVASPASLMPRRPGDRACGRCRDARDRGIGESRVYGRTPAPLPCAAMRIALVSPYSWTYPGGVTRHIEALAEQLAAAGTSPRMLDAVRPRRPRSARGCTAAPRPQAREPPAQRRRARAHGRPARERRRLERRARSGGGVPAARGAARRRLRRRARPRADRARRSAGTRSACAGAARRAPSTPTRPTG